MPTFCAVKLLLSVVEDTSGVIETNDIYNRYNFACIESSSQHIAPRRLFLEHVVKLFPDVHKLRRRVGTDIQTLYTGVSLKPLDKLQTDHNQCDIRQYLPAYINIKETQKECTVCELSTHMYSNGHPVVKQIKFYSNGTWHLLVGGKEVELRNAWISDQYQSTDEGVKLVCEIVQRTQLCVGVTVTKSVVMSRYHTLESLENKELDTVQRSVRSVLCHQIVPFNSKNNLCIICQRMTLSKPMNVHNRNMETKQQAVQENETPKSLKEQKKQNTINRDDIKHIIPQASEEMIDLLVDQTKNADRDPRGRRWSKSVITICLQLYNKSPHGYESFRNSGILLLPCPSLLILYKNSMKQEVGFSRETFRWMFEEAKRRQIPPEGWIGGIILDEMAIQADIQISKTGDVVELSGFVDTGEEGNMYTALRANKHEKKLGTHVLQFVFLGLSGFRFPFAHFLTDQVQAPQIHTLFWEAVDMLQMYSFRCAFTIMDGAQCNRSFMHLNHVETNFTTPSPCSLENVIFIMDVSHVLKKLRNNVIKSGLKKGCTRNLTLADTCSNIIQWQMFVDAFQWDQCNSLPLHRKLTIEHIYPSTQSKMRNHLAEEVLNEDMHHLMLQYQATLGDKGSVLNGAIEFLSNTSKVIKIFRDMKPVRSMDDSRLTDLSEVAQWFAHWKEGIEHDSNIPKKNKSGKLLSYQCHEDIQSCLIGFNQLCEMMSKSQNKFTITPALINSDVIENTFNQQRSTYNGANSNPNALQYRHNLNSIVLGQNTVSVKANAGKSVRLPATPYCMLTHKSLKRRPTSEHGCNVEKIKVIRV